MIITGAVLILIVMWGLAARAHYRATKNDVHWNEKGRP